MKRSHDLITSGSKAPKTSTSLAALGALAVACTPAALGVRCSPFESPQPFVTGTGGSHIIGDGGEHGGGGTGAGGSGDAGPSCASGGGSTYCVHVIPPAEPGLGVICDDRGDRKVCVQGVWICPSGTTDNAMCSCFRPWFGNCQTCMLTGWDCADAAADSPSDDAPTGFDARAD
jgi:hypothetical protein